MTAKRICISLLFLLSTSPAFAKIQGNTASDYIAAASKVVNVVKPAVLRNRVSVKRRLIIPRHTGLVAPVIRNHRYSKEI